jgi:hypothetical protein
VLGRQRRLEQLVADLVLGQRGDVGGQHRVVEEVGGQVDLALVQPALHRPEDVVHLALLQRRLEALGLEGRDALDRRARLDVELHGALRLGEAAQRVLLLGEPGGRLGQLPGDELDRARGAGRLPLEALLDVPLHQAGHHRLGDPAVGRGERHAHEVGRVAAAADAADRQRGLQVVVQGAVAAHDQRDRLADREREARELQRERRGRQALADRQGVRAVLSVLAELDLQRRLVAGGQPQAHVARVVRRDLGEGDRLTHRDERGRNGARAAQAHREVEGHVAALVGLGDVQPEILEHREQELAAAHQLDLRLDVGAGAGAGQLEQRVGGQQRAGRAHLHDPGRRVESGPTAPRARPSARGRRRTSAAPASDAAGARRATPTAPPAASDPRTRPPRRPPPTRRPAPAGSRRGSDSASLPWALAPPSADEYAEIPRMRPIAGGAPLRMRRGCGAIQPAVKTIQGREGREVRSRPARAVKSDPGPEGREVRSRPGGP